MNKVNIVKSLKDNFDNFKKSLLIRSITTSENSMSGRKKYTPSKYDEFSLEKKEILSDFIRFYDLFEKNNNCSYGSKLIAKISFMFAYENVPEEIVSIGLQIDNQDIIYSNSMNINDFKVFIKEMNKCIVSENNESVIDVIKNKIKEIKQDNNINIDYYENKTKDLKEKKLEISKELEEIKGEISLYEKELVNSDEFLYLKKIEELMIKAKKDKDLKNKELIEKHRIDIKVKEKDEKEKILLNIMNELENQQYNMKKYKKIKGLL